MLAPSVLKALEELRVIVASVFMESLLSKDSFPAAAEDVMLPPNIDLKWPPSVCVIVAVAL